MKKLAGKNKLAVLALAVMIGVAGYMSFADSGKDKKDTKKNEKQVEVLSYDEISAKAEAENQAKADSESAVSEEGLTEEIELNGPEDEIGDAVLTSAEVTRSNMAVAKLTREQSRSKSKEALMDVIGDESISDEAKKEATDTYVKLSDVIEKETDVETILAAKGYADAIVTISDEAVDVALGTDDISDTEKAQIEDIVTRKTGYNISDVVISVMGEK